jgi:glycosyltransferase involved in cell wall biosynthesis
MLGWLDITQIDAVARKSDFAILPLKPLFDFQMSYPNKFFDYISRGKPVLSNLAGATKNLIEKENLGYYYSNFEDLLKLVENYEKKLLDLDTISGNCLRVYQQKFSFDKTYKNILDNLMDITR